MRFRYSQTPRSEQRRLPWELHVLPEVLSWINDLDQKAREISEGPQAGRPMVDTLKGSNLANLKELHPGNMRILFAFDPWRRSVLLVAGDKTGKWQQWYKEAIPLAERRYASYLKERRSEGSD
ncbi:type II toxin-antitoxin system RelE/ParE family toxin [Glycomyces sp. NPDC049804]|uniref:type II toxin-antitoxin system RelE/ParE family toxin n=1 Tax=Glycomyces sp. NPDC049804 TaxID=3154363 RepID=UPI0034274106